MVYLECIPGALKKGLIVPIPKANKDSSIKDNNRGITLLPVIYKLLQMVLLEREKPWLQTIIDDMQGAKHAKCSCLHVSLLKGFFPNSSIRY